MPLEEQRKGFGAKIKNMWEGQLLDPSNHLKVCVIPPFSLVLIIRCYSVGITISAQFVYQKSYLQEERAQTN